MALTIVLPFFLLFKASVTGRSVGGRGTALIGGWATLTGVGGPSVGKGLRTTGCSVGGLGRDNVNMLARPNPTPAKVAPLLGLFEGDFLLRAIICHETEISFAQCAIERITAHGHASLDLWCDGRMVAYTTPGAVCLTHSS